MMMVGFNDMVLVIPEEMPESNMDERSPRFMEEPANRAAMSTSFPALGRLCGAGPAELLTKGCACSSPSGIKTGAGVTTELSGDDRSGTTAGAAMRVSC